MKNKFTLLCVLAFFVTKYNAQTPGILTFTFTPAVKTATACYASPKNAMAIWIQTNTGTFVKTKLRNAGPGGGTQDHLPTYAVNSGGAASNCLGAGCNIVSATTGATRASFLATSITWDGTDVAGALVADGIYKVTIEQTWNHGATGTAVTSFTFNKGASVVNLTPANTTEFTNIKLDWVPSSVGIEDIAINNPEVSVFPNPTTGVFNLNLKKANQIKVYNTLGMLILDEKTNESEGTKQIDLSSFSNGIYTTVVSNENGFATCKLILNK